MKYTITCLALLLTMFLHAQNSETKHADLDWHFGVKGDYNMSNVSGNGMATGFTSGFQLGGFAVKAFNDQFSVQPELLFTQNNSKRASNFIEYYLPPQGNTFSAENIKLGYISVPVIFKYKINKYFNVVAGPQYSQMVFDAESLTGSNTDGNKGTAFKRNEISGNAGAEFNVGSVAIYGRYNHGFTNINNVDNRYKWYSSHIQIGVAIKIK